MNKQVNIQTDPVSDMLSRLRNAILINKAEVEMPHSRLKQQVAQILMDYGFISGVGSEGKQPFKTLKLTINQPDQPAAITSISRISRPGRRTYVKASEIPVVKRGRGIVVLSTSKGVMASPEAKAQGVGGELMCEVY